MKKNVVYDMETNDFDDYLTLCLLAGSNKVNLVGVTLNPGTDEQVGLVRETLKRFKSGNLVLIGASNIKPLGRGAVIAPIHYKVEKFVSGKPDMYAEQLLHHMNVKYEDLTILTGAGLTNIANYLKKYSKDTITSMYIQGGFAGSNIVAAEDELEKFKGVVSKRTYNFCCDIGAAQYVLNSERVMERHLVSKNVCHGTCYDVKYAEELEKRIEKTESLQAVMRGMKVYNKPKMLHDPLMAVTSIEDGVCTFEEVEMQVTPKGEWSAHKKKGTHTYISVKCDYAKFYSCFCA